jgi:hypothetical protein
MKFYKLSSYYYINLEDIKYFKIDIMSEIDYEYYNGKTARNDAKEYMLYITYKNSKTAISYPLTPAEKNKFLAVISQFEVI